MTIELPAPPLHTTLRGSDEGVGEGGGSNGVGDGVGSDGVGDGVICGAAIDGLGDGYFAASEPREAPMPQALTHTSITARPASRPMKG